MKKLKGKALVLPPQDNRDDMVKKLEVGTTVTKPHPQLNVKSSQDKVQEKVKKNLNHIQCLMCSNMGRYASMCKAKIENKKRPSRSPRRSIKSIVCFGCKNKGHMIMSCPNEQIG